jgi:SAM-dependent methyltransferase
MVHPDEPHALDYLDRNQETWSGNAAGYAEPGRRNWSEEFNWGIWHIPESDLGLLPEVAGALTVELGCGTGYISAWLARLGARPIGVDLTPEQLATAQQLQREFGLSFPLVRAAAEQAPLRDGCCDLVISEYGAAIWSDPHRWIPEAARLLRPGGHLIFLGNSTIFMLCIGDEEDVPAGDALKRPYFGMHRFEWDDDNSVEFHLGYGDWIRLLRGNGFEIVDLVELPAPAGATTRHPYVDPDWSQQWPAEEVWKVQKR